MLQSLLGGKPSHGTWIQEFLQQVQTWLGDSLQLRHLVIDLAVFVGPQDLLQVRSLEWLLSGQSNKQDHSCREYIALLVVERLVILLRVNKCWQSCTPNSLQCII